MASVVLAIIKVIEEAVVLVDDLLEVLRELLSRYLFFHPFWRALRDQALLVVGTVLRHSDVGDGETQNQESSKTKKKQTHKLSTSLAHLIREKCHPRTSKLQTCHATQHVHAGVQIRGAGVVPGCADDVSGVGKGVRQRSEATNVCTVDCNFCSSESSCGGKLERKLSIVERLQAVVER